MSNRRGQRSPHSTALEWSTRITTLGFELALPAGLGYWLDTQWGTGPWLLIVGAVLGFVTFMTHLFQLAKVMGEEGSDNSRNRKSQTK